MSDQARDTPEGRGADPARRRHLERIRRGLGGDIEPSLLAADGTHATIAMSARELGLDEAAYAELVSRGGEEAARLRARLVPPETWFFRYPASFEHLREVTRRQRDSGSTEALRIAVLGCANGAEAFSIAAAVESICTVEIVAVDRDAASITVARSGRLPPGSLRQPPPSWAADCWRAGPGAVIVREDLRQRVSFELADFFDPALHQRLGQVDAVFCRNVAIYLGALWRCRLGALIRDILRPGGWLYHGHAESAAALGLPWEERSTSAFAVRSPPMVAAASPSTPAHRPATSGTGRASALATEFRAPQRARGERTSASDSPAATGSGASALQQARRLADLGRAGEAWAAAEAAHRQGERSAELFELLGTLAIAGGRFGEAAGHLRSALYLEPQRETAAIQLALLSERHHA